MTREVVVVDERWKTRLVVAAARREVAELDFLAAVTETVREVQQMQVATLLRTNQSMVSRWAARGRELAVPRDRVARSAYEVAQRYALGELTREQMLQALTTWTYEPSPAVQVQEWHPMPAPEVPESFEATVGRAHAEGLISGEDYDAVLDALAD